MTTPEQEEATTLKIRDLLGELKLRASSLRMEAIATERVIVRLHEAMGGLGRGNDAWVATFGDEGTMVDLGNLVDMANAMAARAAGAQTAIQQITSVALGAITQVSGNEGDRMADALAAGMTESAAACTCAVCPNCKLIDARGPEIAVPEIQRRMRGMLVIPRDRLRGNDRQVKLVSDKN